MKGIKIREKWILQLTRYFWELVIQRKRWQFCIVYHRIKITMILNKLFDTKKNVLTIVLLYFIKFSVLPTEKIEFPKEKIEFSYL